MFRAKSWTRYGIDDIYDMEVRIIPLTKDRLDNRLQTRYMNSHCILLT